MALIVMMTALIGWLASFVLLRLGVEHMGLRYPLATAVAYLGFLGLIGVWLRTNGRDYVDPVSDLMANHGGDVLGGLERAVVAEAPAPRFDGSGGQFAGGGATSDWHEDALPSATGAELELADGLGDAFGSVSDADEFAIPLAVVFVLLGLAFASLYVVYAAPLLLAEVLVDGAIAYAFFRHIRDQEARHWLTSALRRSILPFALTAVFLSAMGVVMGMVAPEAHSIGGVIRHASVS